MTHDIDGVPDFESADDEREWLLQEEALRCERLGLDAGSEGKYNDDYRLLAKVLRQPLKTQLTADFATQVVLRATASASSVGFENVLTIVLIVVMMLVAAAIVVMHGNEWTASFSRMAFLLKQPGGNWLTALIACVTISWAGGQTQCHTRRV